MAEPGTPEHCLTPAALAKSRQRVRPSWPVQSSSSFQRSLAAWLVLCGAVACAHAQSPAATALGTAPQTTAALPSQPPASGTISGKVTDRAGDPVAGANVALAAGAGQPSVTISDASGQFAFTALLPGTYELTVSAPGLTPSVVPAIHLQPGQSDVLAPVALAIATATTNVQVTVSRQQIATEQVHVEEQQRVLGIVPNFYASYVWKAAPLNSKEKFHLALRYSVDPINIGIDAVVAGVEQWQNGFRGYGQGAQGYFKRFGANYTDDFVGTFLGSGLFPSILHQDPRFFYKGTGSVGSRALYAIETTVICRGDNGRWQPNYSFVLGNFAAGGISNLYYPATDRGAGLTTQNALIGIGSSAIFNLLQEFVIPRFTPHRPPDESSQPENNPGHLEWLPHVHF